MIDNKITTVEEALEAVNENGFVLRYVPKALQAQIAKEAGIDYE